MIDWPVAFPPGTVEVMDDAPEETSDEIEETPELICEAADATSDDMPDPTDATSDEPEDTADDKADVTEASAEAADGLAVELLQPAAASAKDVSAPTSAVVRMRVMRRCSFLLAGTVPVSRLRWCGLMPPSMWAASGSENASSTNDDLAI